MKVGKNVRPSGAGGAWLGGEFGLPNGCPGACHIASGTGKEKDRRDGHDRRGLSDPWCCVPQLTSAFDSRRGHLGVGVASGHA